jgi:hypothetical protein
MAEETFETFVQRERDRLNAQREALLTQQQELEDQIALVDRELSAVDAYEAAKTGKAPPQSRGRGRRATGTRRGSRRAELLKVISSGKGLTRGEILEKMGLKGNKTGEMSISNALTALIKGKQVSRKDRKYLAA